MGGAHGGMPGRGDIGLRQVDLSGVGDARGVVVVVDVLRAFTVAALALHRGARAVRCVTTVTEALAEREANPGSLAIGEVGGRPVDGFDLPNSPSTILEADVADRLLVHRSSAGTQGVVGAAAGATALYAASFVCAAATARAVAARAPDEVTFVLTGVDERDGDEDRACADYIGALIVGQQPEPEPYLERIAASDAGRAFLEGDAHFPASDLAQAARLDAVDFAMLARMEDARPTLYRQA